MQRPDPVLSVVWYQVRPSTFGGQKGIAHFSQCLGLHLPLRMLCSRNNSFKGIESYDHDAVLPVSKTQFIDPTAWREIERTLVRNGSSTLLLEHCYYGLTGIWLKRKHNCRLVVHSHNIEYLRFREQGKWWWPLLYRIEKAAHRHADLSLFKTEEDMAHGIDKFRLDPGTCMVVPYGTQRTKAPGPGERSKASAWLREKFGIPSEKKVLLFNGTLDYVPNARAVERIVGSILPLLGDAFHVIVCGRILHPRFKGLRELKGPNYTYAGFVDDIDFYFLGSDAFINPVHQGGGIKTKVVEALSWGLPVVSYRSGATGISRDLCGPMLSLVGDLDDKAFAEAVRQINYSDALPDAFYQHYDWQRITGTVANRIRQLQAE